MLHQAQGSFGSLKCTVMGQKLWFLWLRLAKGFGTFYIAEVAHTYQETEPFHNFRLPWYLSVFLIDGFLLCFILCTKKKLFFFFLISNSSICNIKGKPKRGFICSIFLSVRPLFSLRHLHFFHCFKNVVRIYSGIFKATTRIWMPDCSSV